MFIHFQYLTANTVSPMNTYFILFTNTIASAKDDNTYQQDYGKNIGQIFLNLGGKVFHGPRKNPVNI